MPRTRTPTEDFEEPYDPAEDSDPLVLATEELAAAREIVEVVTREHSRISRDLHDNVGQELYVLRLMATHLTESLREQHSDLVRFAEDLDEHIAVAQKQLRLAIKGVYPREVDRDGLPRALRRLAAEYGRLSRIEYACEAPESLVLHDHETAEALLQIAKQACRNAAQYARPTRIAMRLSEEQDGVHLVVENDGLPFDLDDQKSASGFGLHLMRLRARSINARFDIKPGSGGGARLEVVLPSRRNRLLTPGGGGA